ncbi:MAG: hypothetical protein H6851_03285 [Geminicoccaceae bacterium]|nr:hypothetical protein [Geminicoccaceae bacterium]MCB9942631.1 hypothetical protein [Geminicoccaceae bacterium]
MRLPALVLVLSTFIPNGGKTAESVHLEGEIIDTWCYFSGVMGGTDAVVGSAHHTCALWCAAGGIPVGLLTDDGSVYLILGFNGEDPVNNDRLMDVQSQRLTVEGTAYERDGLRYLSVEQVVSTAGIVNRNHEDFGPVPPFAIPELN